MLLHIRYSNIHLPRIFFFFHSTLVVFVCKRNVIAVAKPVGSCYNTRTQMHANKINREETSATIRKLVYIDVNHCCCSRKKKTWYRFFSLSPFLLNKNKTDALSYWFQRYIVCNTLKMIHKCASFSHVFVVLNRIL